MVERCHRRDAGLLHGGDHLVGVGQAGGQRLLHQDRLAGLGGLDGDRGVQVVRGGHDHQVDVGTPEQGAVVVGGHLRAVAARDLVRGGVGDARHPDQPGARVSGHHRRVRRAHHPRPDHRDTDTDTGTDRSARVLSPTFRHACKRLHTAVGRTTRPGCRFRHAPPPDPRLTCNRLHGRLVGHSRAPCGRSDVGTLGWLVLGAYFVVMVGIGVWAKRRIHDARDFFTAGGRMPWWLVRHLPPHVGLQRRGVRGLRGGGLPATASPLYVWWALTITVAMFVGRSSFAPAGPGCATLRHRLPAGVPLHPLQRARPAGCSPGAAPR